ncbi:HTH domain-containing protein [Aerococcaceae bacterium zg-B36]|uniref:helix-turn-helix transcriptional regulator n=1 Tax=Aerococcaceae bacterium zg-252 TaxID=2796928 RepID=UPI001BD8F5BD|nr:HTH domain-containing protein [Aerococcaceae bacterium zg-B36]
MVKRTNLMVVDGSRYHLLYENGEIEAVFDYDLETVRERNDYVSKMLECDADWKQHHLEEMKTYIFRSKNVKSPRKIEYRFFQDKSTLGKSKRFEKCEYFETDVKHVLWQTEEISDEYLDRMFSVNNLTPLQKRKIIRYALSDFDEFAENERLTKYLKDLYDDLLSCIQDRRELSILYYLIQNKSVYDIANKFGVTRQAIEKKIKNISEKY